MLTFAPANHSEHKTMDEGPERQYNWHFTLTKEFLEEIRSLVEIRDTERLSELIAELHPTDLAEIVDADSTASKPPSFFLP